MMMKVILEIVMRSHMVSAQMSVNCACQRSGFRVVKDLKERKGQLD